MTMSRNLSSIAVIIVNYGTADLAIAAVESVLRRAHDGRHVRVHLVDNASPGTDAQKFQSAHVDRGWDDRVILYPETQNHGFGCGNNVVLSSLLAQSSPPDAFLLLNPDARLENEAIDLLAAALEARPDAAFCGAGIAKPDGTAVTAAFRFPTAAGEFAQALNLGPVTRALARWEIPLPPDHPAGDVDWVAGAALMIRRAALEDIGLFDPDFFLYFEEVELMRRGRRAGWRCLYVPEARVVHVEGAATDVKSMRRDLKRHPAYRYHSWRLYHIKTGGRIAAVGAALATLAGASGNRLIAAVGLRPSRSVPYFFRDFWTHAMRPILSRSGRPVE